MSNDAQEENTPSALTADEHHALKRGLQNLPETMPPRIVWERIRDQAAAEGLLKTHRTPTWQWLVGSGIAASVALGVLLVLPIQPGSEPPSVVSQIVPDAVPTNQHGVTALQALMVESSRLEANLRHLPERPRVTRAGTAATITEIQDRVAAIDFQLGQADGALTPEQEQALWADRVRLMKSLVSLRYAQTQRMAL